MKPQSNITSGGSPSFKSNRSHKQNFHKLKIWKDGNLIKEKLTSTHVFFKIHMWLQALLNLKPPITPRPLTSSWNSMASPSFVLFISMYFTAHSASATPPLSHPTDLSSFPKRDYGEWLSAKLPHFSIYVSCRWESCTTLQVLHYRFISSCSLHTTV